MKRLLAVLLALAGCGRGKAWDAEVEALDGLREGAGAEEFRSGRATEELLAAFDEAAPALRRGLASRSWAVRARCLDIAFRNELHGIEGLDLSAGARDPSVHVRAVAAGYGGACTPGGGSLLKEPAVASLLQQRVLLFREPVELPPELRRRRLDRLFAILEDEAPLRTPDPGEIGLPLKPLSAAASTCLARELRDGPDGHALLDRLLAALRAVPPGRTERLIVLFDLCRSVGGHQDPSHPSPCPKDVAFRAALQAVLGERVSTSSPPLLLETAMFLLEGFEGGRALLRRVAGEHADPELRRRAAWHLREAAGR